MRDLAVGTVGCPVTFGSVGSPVRFATELAFVASNFGGQIQLHQSFVGCFWRGESSKCHELHHLNITNFVVYTSHELLPSISGCYWKGARPPTIQLSRNVSSKYQEVRIISISRTTRSQFLTNHVHRCSGATESVPCCRPFKCHELYRLNITNC